MDMSLLLQVPVNDSEMLLGRSVTHQPHLLMLNWGMEQAPHEACGLVIGQSELSGAVMVLHLRNIAAKPKTEWRIDTGWVMTQLFPGMTRAEFYDSVMVWHSHPGGTVGPSRLDCDTMKLGVHYCVVTVPTGEVVRYERDN